jgi:hypothetical protein
LLRLLRWLARRLYFQLRLRLRLRLATPLFVLLVLRERALLFWL